MTKVKQNQEEALQEKINFLKKQEITGDLLKNNGFTALGENAYSFPLMGGKSLRLDVNNRTLYISNNKGRLSILGENIYYVYQLDEYLKILGVKINW